MMQRRAFLAASLLTPLCLQAQETAWPTRPLRLLVGSAPGGGTDAMARAVADPLASLLGQPVLVENRPGVSNTLAVDMAVKSTDGHTAVMGVVTAHAIAPHLLKLGYDNNRDLTPVAYVGSVPNVLVVSNHTPAHTVAELIALAKATPTSPAAAPAAPSTLPPKCLKMRRAFKSPTSPTRAAPPPWSIWSAAKCI